MLSRLLSVSNPLASWVLAAIVLSLPFRAQAQGVGAGVQEIRDCIEDNFPDFGKQKAVLERTDPAGSKRTLEATSYWKQTPEGRLRFLLRIDAPPDERGSAFLLIEDTNGRDLFAYLPELRTVRRLSGRAVSGSMFGTDFSYEDIVELQNQAEHSRIERLPDAEHEGRKVRVLSATPTAGSESAYSRVVSFVDAETCVVLRTELYGDSEQLDREIGVSWTDVDKQGERWRPRKISLVDHRKGSQSVLQLGDGDWTTEVPDRLFNQSELAKGR